MGAIGPTSDPGIAGDFTWDAITKHKDGIIKAVKECFAAHL